MMSEQSLMSSDTSQSGFGSASVSSLLSSLQNYSENSVSGNDSIELEQYESTIEYESYNGDFLLFNNQENSNDFIVWNLFYGFGIALTLALVIFFVKVCWDTFKKLT